MQRADIHDVPQSPQGHQLHTRSQSPMRRMPSQNTLPRLRTRIPSSRHARNMGRHDLKTTTNRTKKTRNTTHQTNPLPNVGRLNGPTRQTLQMYQTTVQTTMWRQRRRRLNEKIHHTNTPQSGTTHTARQTSIRQT